jgi:hypothetical protein
MRWDFLALILGCGCGDSDATQLIALPQELPMLTSLADKPFNHASEVTIAAKDGRVVVASINQRLASPETFDPPVAQEFRKRVAINVSSDGGRTYAAAIDPGFGTAGTDYGDETTDPVVRVGADGTFFVTIFHTSLMEGQGAVARSSDGLSWTTLFSAGIGDKPWMAIDDLNRQLFVAGAGGYWRLSLDGSVLQERLPEDGPEDLMVDAYAQNGHVRFATGGRETGTPATASIIDWDGTSADPTVVATVDVGAEADLTTIAAWSHGPLPNGSWAIHVRRQSGHSGLILRTDVGGNITESPVTPADGSVFLPAAAMDERGRLHVIWYDSSQETGRLLYAYSLGVAPFSEGFSEPAVVDDNTCPGNGWWPDSQGDLSTRRLREYIGIAIDGDVVHAAWTHAPQAPSRIWVTRINPPRVSADDGP